MCIIGGGPAGLAAAIALRGRGFSVAVFDCTQPPIDKACGEGVLPDGIAALATLGVNLPGFPFHGIRFVENGTSVSGDFPRSPALGVRRIVLHEALGQCAERAGAALFWGTTDARLDEVRAKWIVGADGMNSRVRQESDLAAAKCEERRYGFRRHYRIAPWSPYMELHWGEQCQIYVTPVASDEIGIALISRDPKLRLDEALLRFPELRERLAGIEQSSTERGAITATRVLLRVSTENIALIGDASGSVDAITGEGLALSFRQALALADAIQNADLRLYEKTHRMLSRRPHRMASLLLKLERYPRFRRRTLKNFAEHPEMFSKLLAIHVGP